MDTDLVVRAQRGDDAAFSALVSAAAGRLRAVAMTILKDHDLADDATQRSLVSIWRNLRDLRDPSRFDAWSHRMVANACYAQLRDARRVSSVPPPSPGYWPASGTPFDLVADHEVIDLALARLPANHRVIVALHHQFGLPLERVARVLGVPVGTVYSRHHRAMDGLRAAIEADERAGIATPDVGPAQGPLPPPRARPWVPGPVPPPPASVDGRRIVVAQDGSGDASSIDDAVRMARDGDLVLIRPGIYRESVVVRRDIAIVGDGDRDLIVLDYHGRDETITLRCPAGCGTFTTPHGVVFDHTRATLANLTIRGPRESIAMIVVGGAPTIRAVTGWLDGAWQGPAWLRYFLLVIGGAGGLVTDCASDAHVHVSPGSPRFERNDLGGWLALVGPTSRSIVRDNAILVRTRTPMALAVDKGASPTIEGNEVSWFGGAAIWIGGNAPSSPIIRGNVIRGSRTGISLVAGSPIITENDIEATTTGIMVFGADPHVSGNLLSGTAPGGIVVVGGSRATLERNAVDPTVHSRPVPGSATLRPTITHVTGAAR